MAPISYRRHRFPPVVIQHAVWLYLRFTLSYRDVEELLAERGLDISYESVRSWVLKFGPAIARGLRRCRPRPSDRWHLDEMVVRIAGKRMYLWRAVDHEGEVLKILVQRRRDRSAAVKLMRKLLRKQGFAPTRVTTDKLRSYGAAFQHLELSCHHEQRYSPSGSSLVVSAVLSTLPSRKRSSQRTQRWREVDSNHRSPSRDCRRSERFAQRSQGEVRMSFGETESSMSLPSREDPAPPPKVSVRRPGSDRWNLASTTFPDAEPMVRIRFPPAESHLRTWLSGPRPVAARLARRGEGAAQRALFDTTFHTAQPKPLIASSSSRGAESLISARSTRD